MSGDLEHEVVRELIGQAQTAERRNILLEKRGEELSQANRALREATLITPEKLRRCEKAILKRGVRGKPFPVLIKSILLAAGMREESCDEEYPF